MPVLAMIGVLGGIAYVVRGSAPPPVAQPAAPPTAAPYRSYIAGSGMLEASTRNIAISTPVGGVVREVFGKAVDGLREGFALRWVGRLNYGLDSIKKLVHANDIVVPHDFLSSWCP